MARDREPLNAKVKRLERENRVFREREQDFEERYQGPADVEGVGGRPAVIILRDKNMGEVKKVIDDLPNIPGLRPDGHPEAPPLGFRRAKAYCQNEVAKMIFALVTVGPVNTARVKDFQRLDMFIHNRAGKLIRPRGDVIGEATRDALHGLVVRIVFAPSAWHLSATSQETEVQPVEAERKGFG